MDNLIKYYPNNDLLELLRMVKHENSQGIEGKTN
jgi:hypothetical protein